MCVRTCLLKYSSLCLTFTYAVCTSNSRSYVHSNSNSVLVIINPIHFLILAAMLFTSIATLILSIVHINHLEINITFMRNEKENFVLTCPPRRLIGASRPLKCWQPFFWQSLTVCFVVPCL